MGVSVLLGSFGQYANTDNVCERKANDRIHTNQQLLPSAPSQSDLDWALGLQQSVQEGYRTTVVEIERYTAINKQYQQQQQENNNGRSDKSKAESDEEMMWALQLLDSFQHGKIPTDEEIENMRRLSKDGISTKAKNRALHIFNNKIRIQL